MEGVDHHTIFEHGTNPLRGDKLAVVLSVTSLIRMVVLESFTNAELCHPVKLDAGRRDEYAI